MATVATASVKITADTSGLRKGEADVQRFAGSLSGKTAPALKLVTDHGTKAHLSMGKLRQEFQTMTRQITGMNPVVTQLAGVLGEFALGGPLVVGILGGVAAIAFAYDKLTGAARKAREENEKLADTLVEAMKLKALGPGGSTQQQVKGSVVSIDALIKERNKISGTMGKIVYTPEARAAKLAEIQGKIDAYVAGVVGGEKEIYEARMAAITGITSVVTAKRNGAKPAGMSNEDWSMNNPLYRPPAEAAPMANVKGGYDGLSGEAAVQWDRMIKIAEDSATKAAQHAEAIRGAIGQSAMAIVSALNIGGGGKGSTLLGSIGSSFGATVGGTLGKLGLGGPVGAIAGSLLGGALDKLFGGNKKAARSSSDALDRMAKAARDATEALTNLPAGFRVAAYRYGATDTSGGSPGGGNTDSPNRPRGGGGPSITIHGDLVVQANDPEEIGRAVARRVSRGGSSRLSFAMAG